MKLILIAISLFFVLSCSRPAITEGNTMADFGTVEESESATDFALEKEFAEIAKDAKGKVGVAAVVIETGQSASLNADQHFPMQSVYKLPISMAVIDKAKDKIDLDKKVKVEKSDYLRQGQHSPIRDKYPNGAELTVRELIEYAIKESDGTASDVLIRVAGGAEAIQTYVADLGITEMKIKNTEKEMDENWNVQYDNWASPEAALALLKALWGQKGTCPKGADCKELILLRYMYDSTPGKNRLKGLLPEGTPVAHKTGTSGTQDGITAATNDIGIITLPNDNHLAIAVFVGDSSADEKVREAVIARIAKAAWDRWSEQTKHQ